MVTSGRAPILLSSTPLDFFSHDSLADSACSRSSGFHCSSARLAGHLRGTGQRVERSAVKQRPTAEKCGGGS
jgi:hypothetical protein